MMPARFDTAQTSFPADEAIAQMNPEQRRRTADACERVLEAGILDERYAKGVRRLYLDLTEKAK